MSTCGVALLYRLDSVRTTVAHGPGFLCRIETDGLPPSEGVAETATDATGIALYIQRVTAMLYVQPWGRA